MRVTRLEIRDILGVREVDLVLPPEEAVHIIGGPNGGGKSSALAGLLVAMVDAGGHPSEALRRGAAKGAVRVTFDDGMIVTRRVRRGKAPQLTVVDGDGGPLGVGEGGPQRGVLDKLFSKFTWDPTGALRLPDRELRQRLMQLAGIDWADLDKEAAQVYDERTTANVVAARSRVQLESLPQHADAPAKHADTVALVAEQQQAREHDAAGEELREQYEGAKEDVEGHEGEISGIETEISELKARLMEQESFHELALAARRKAQFAVENWKPLARTGAVIEAELAAAGKTNAMAEARARYEEQAQELQQHEAEAQAYTDRLKEIEAEKQQQLEAAEFPVAGLTVSDDGVLYNDLPFDQAEESARLRVSVAIGIQLNPKLPTMICRHGGGLDEQGIELLKEIVAEGGGQLLLEHPWVPPSRCTAYIKEGRAEKPGQGE